MITQQQFHVYYTDYTVMIDSMTEKLSLARNKNPDADYSQSFKTIETLKFLRQLFHSMYHTQQSIDNDSGKIMAERHQLIAKINQLQKENNNLKENIKL